MATTALPTETRRHAVPGLPDRPINVHEYDALLNDGVLTPSDNVELLDGWVVTKMGHGDDHCRGIEKCDEALRPLLPAEVRIRCQLPVVVAFKDEPEADFSVVRRVLRVTDRVKPHAEDTLLVVEIANSTLYEDRTRKLVKYARAGIPIYWIVNLVRHAVEVYTAPTQSGPDGGPTYATRRDYRAGESVPLILDGREIGRIPAAELLP